MCERERECPSSRVCICERDSVGLGECVSERECVCE